MVLEAELPKPSERKRRPDDYAQKNIWEECGRCDGHGSVWWGVDISGAVRESDGTVREVSKVCFDCSGTGGQHVSQQQLDRREADRKRREAARQKKAQERVAQAEAERQAKREEYQSWIGENPRIAQALKSTRGPFADDMREQAEQFRVLSERQIEVLLSIAEDQAQEPEPAPVVEGKCEITGRVLSTKWSSSSYNGVSRSDKKMVVLDDRGFKVYGTVPSSILTDAKRGSRVRFTATNEVSEDDETFGFFKRPSKAEVLE